LLSDKLIPTIADQIVPVVPDPCERRTVKQTKSLHRQKVARVEFPDQGRACEGERIGEPNDVTDRFQPAMDAIVDNVRPVTVVRRVCDQEAGLLIQQPSQG
jgi:hypothetical protein